jgi:DNA-binding Lrp family transcriptional regulator
MIQFDDIDLMILATLQANARIPNPEIAREVGMAPSAAPEVHDVVGEDAFWSR